MRSNKEDERQSVILQCLYNTTEGATVSRIPMTAKCGVENDTKRYYQCLDGCDSKESSAWSLNLKRASSNESGQ